MNKGNESDKKPKQEIEEAPTKQELPTKIDGSELDKLKKFDANVKAMIQILGESTLEKINVDLRLEAITSKIEEVEASYKTLIQNRDQYTTELIEKYGTDIRINPNTGDISR